MAIHTSLIVVAIVLTASSASALYSKSDAVVELTAANFDKLVLQSDGVAVVEFYAPWCGHCQSLAPQFKKVASNLQGMALVGAVDCNDQKTAGALCTRYGVKGFPTLKLFGSDKTKNPYTGELSKEPTDYNGPRTAKPIADAVTGLLTDLFITKLNSKAALGEWAGKAAAGKAQVLLFTNKEGSTTLYKALSTQLRAGLAFAEVHESASDLVSEFGVTSFPALVVVKADGSGRETYSGDLKAAALLKYLKAFSTAASSDSGEGSSGGDKETAKPKKPAEPAWTFVRQLAGNVTAELAELDSREDMALLAVHGAGEDGCKGAREAFLNAAGDMQAVVDTLLLAVSAEDVAEASAAAALTGVGLDAATLATDPCELQVVLLPFGKDKADLDDYKKYAGPPDGKELQRWVTDAIPTFVTQIDDENAGPFLAVDPSEGRMALAPKAILFTNKPEAPGVFRALALALRGRGNMGFAWVQVGTPSSARTVESFKPPKVPTLSIIMPQVEPGKTAGDPGGVRFGMQPYHGQLKFTPMLQFLSEFAAQVETSSGIVKDPEVIAKALPQITSQAELEASCTGKAGLCLLALLDSSDPGFEEEHKELLALALQQNGDTAFHFVWMEGRKHRSVMQAFGVMHSDVPTLVALSARRMRFAVLPAPEDEGSGPRLRPQAVGRFVQGVLEGKVRTVALAALPDIRDGDEAPADGASGSGSSGSGSAPAEEEPIVEEEFDLSDIMNEEVEGGAGSKADRMKEVEEELKAEEEARQAAEAAKAKKAAKKKKKAKKAKKAAAEEL